MFQLTADEAEERVEYQQTTRGWARHSVRAAIHI